MRKRTPSKSHAALASRLITHAAIRPHLLLAALAALVLAVAHAPAQQPSPPAQAPVASTNSVAKPKKQVLIFENADLRVVLQAMAKQEGLSLILPDDVKGNVTARLVDIPIRQAMETILSSRGYSLVELDGVYQVKSKDMINSEPLKNDIYQFANAAAKEARPLVEKLLTKASGANVQLDERSNTLIITDVPSNLTKIFPIIKTLDQPTKQVLIEARLLETQRQPTENIGITWPSGFTSALTPNNMVVTENSRPDSGLGVQSIRTAQAQVQGTAIPLGVMAGSLPMVATLTMPQLSATLNILMSDTDTELLGSPKIITADNREAKIVISSQEPIPSYTFNQQSASFTISGFEYKDIGNKLTVTPHINLNDFITLDVEPEVSNRAGVRNFPVGGGQTVDIPLIDKRTLLTRVTLKSGNTLALGGLLSLSSQRTYRKVPFLGDIPGLGELFTNRSFNKTKKNLLIFITPTVVASDGKSGLEDQYEKLQETDESDRYAYKKNFIGNAKPLDQYRSVPKQDMELSSFVSSPKSIVSGTQDSATTMDPGNQEKVVQARLLLKQADRRYSDGNYAAALKACEEAESKLKGVPDVQKELMEARHSQSLCLICLARLAMKDRNAGQAAVMARRAYELDPDNREALAIYEKAERASTLGGGGTATQVPANPSAAEKSEALQKAAVDREAAGTLDPDRLAPRLAPSLRN